MRIKNSEPWFSDETKDLYTINTKRILESGNLISGEYTELLEDEIKHNTGCQFAVALSSGTAALEIILNYINCRGGEVLVPNNTFISTLYALRNAQATPVLVDINKDDFCIDIVDLKAKVTENTKALIIVHLAGYISEDMVEIEKYCKQKNIILIEDSSHAVGAKYKNYIAGNIGLASAVSLYPTKVVTGATGGLITTNDRSLYEYACLARSHGNDSFGRNQFLSPNWFISEFNALLCYLQLKEIDLIVKRRNEIAQFYDEELKKNNILQTPSRDIKRVHPYYKYIVRASFDCNEQNIFSFFESNEISLGKCYGVQLSEHPSTKGIFLNEMRNSKEFSEKHFTLPCHLNLTNIETEKVLEVLSKFLSELK